MPSDLSEFLENQKEVRGKAYDVLVWVQGWSLILFLWVNFLLVIGFFGAGTYYLVEALLALLDDDLKDPQMVSMTKAIKAVELILLAPLSYVFVSTLVGYLSAIDDQQRNWMESLRKVAGAKSLIASLLASIVSVDLVGIVLKSSMAEPGSVSLHWQDIALRCLVIVVLILYLFVIEKGVHHASKRIDPE
ncbi:MAG: hypothetical protein AAGI37_08430 [Planctomycetota bacterium]